MSNDPNQPQPPPPNQGYPAGYAQPGAPGGFTPTPGQAPYAPGGFGAPAMPGYPPPGQPYYPPAGYPPAGYAPPAGYPPPGAPAGYPPPGAPAGYPPPPGSPAGYPPPPGAPAGYPGYNPAYPYQQPPAGAPYHPGYAPPQGPGYGAPPPQPGYVPPGYAPPASVAPPPSTPAAGGMPVAGDQMYRPQEPPTVLYRDITVHNPKYEGGLMVWGYSREDIKRDCDEIVKAADKDKKLIEVLTRLGPLKMEVVAHEFPSHNHKGETLYKLVERKTTRYVEAGLLGLVQGPIRYDAERVKEAIQGIGTKESLLDELLLDLSPTDVQLLSYVYAQRYKTSLLNDVLGDLSGGVRKLFAELLDPTRTLRPYFAPPPGAPGAPGTPASGTPGAPATTGSTSGKTEQKPDDPQALLEEDVAKLYKGGAGRVGTNEATFYKIFTGRTHEHMIQICRYYQEKHKKTLSHDVRGEFSGHEAKALLHIVAGAEINHRYPDVDPQAVRDANMLEETMAGLGTNDGMLVMRILRAHWSPRRMQAMGAAYLRVHEKTLTRRVQGETSGAFEDLLIAMIKGPVVGY